MGSWDATLGAALGSGLRTWFPSFRRTSLTVSNQDTVGLWFVEGFLGMEAHGHEGAPEACCWQVRLWGCVGPRPPEQLLRRVSQLTGLCCSADVWCHKCPFFPDMMVILGGGLKTGVST